MNYRKIIILLIYIISLLIANEDGKFSITRLQYDGGGDWYSDQSSIPNLLKFVDKNTDVSINLKEQNSRIGEHIFNSSPYLYLTGHGNIKFSDKEAIMLRNHLLSGAFLHADDNYGMDESFRLEMTKVFPDKVWVELPFEHKIFHCYYNFPNGLPKVHKHDNKPPQALGLFDDGRLIVLYTYESDLGDGWENERVHSNDHTIRNKALQMGTNIIIYSLMNYAK